MSWIDNHKETNVMELGQGHTSWTCDNLPDIASRVYSILGHVRKLPLEIWECGANKEETSTHYSDGNFCICFETVPLPTNPQRELNFSMSYVKA